MSDNLSVETVPTTETSTDTNQGTTQEVEPTTQTVKTYTEAEVRNMLQAEADRRVSQALETQRKKDEEARLIEQGKYEELYKNLQREKEIAEYKANAQKIFTQKQIPELSDVLMNDLSNTENLSNALDAITSIINTKVQTEVERRLNTGKPVVTNTAPPNTIDPTKMSREQYLQYKKENNLY